MQGNPKQHGQRLSVGRWDTGLPYKRVGHVAAVTSLAAMQVCALAALLSVLLVDVAAFSAQPAAAAAVQQATQQQSSVKPGRHLRPLKADPAKLLNLDTLTKGTKLRGQVVGGIVQGKTGPKVWLDVDVKRPGPGGKYAPVRAMVRVNTPQEQQRVKEGATMNCYVVKIQPNSGRLEASLTKPKQRNLLLEEAMRPREGLIDITTLTTGQALKGTVIAVIRHAAFISCGVGRIDPNPRKRRLNEAGTEQLLQPVNGYLMQSDLVKGVALETQLVMREDTTRVIRVGDTIDCWVKKAWPTEARYCVTLDENITPETVKALAIQNMKARRKHKRTRVPVSALQPGQLLTGE
eukprot:15886-Heterococcus_DN1.PRE.3